MKKDWSGNKKTQFVTIGASNHVDYDRAEHDYYATEPRCAEELLNLGLGIKNIWECACGEGHIAKVFKNVGILGKATDLIDRGYGEGGVDFLEQQEKWDGWIVTNPPYKHANIS